MDYDNMPIEQYKKLYSQYYYQQNKQKIKIIQIKNRIYLKEYYKNYYQQNKDTYKIRYKNKVIKEEKELTKLITYLNKVKL